MRGRKRYGQAFRVLFLAGVGEVVLDMPGFSGVRGALAELANFAGLQGNELQMALELRSVRLRNFIGPIFHHAIFQTTIKENVSADVVDPVLFPALERLIVDVVALS